MLSEELRINDAHTCGQELALRPKGKLELHFRISL